jgi:hypothetical protein
MAKSQRQDRLDTYEGARNLARGIVLDHGGRVTRNGVTLSEENSRKSVGESDTLGDIASDWLTNIVDRVLGLE